MQNLTGSIILFTAERNMEPYVHASTSKFIQYSHNILFLNFERSNACHTPEGKKIRYGLNIFKISMYFPDH
jgi:hypothetical protein